MKKSFGLVLLTLSLMMCLVPFAGAVTTYLRPAKMVLYADPVPGTTVQGSFVVKNVETSGNIVVTMSPTGDLDGITTLSQTQVTLSPGQEKTITFTTTINQVKTYQGSISAQFQPEGGGFSAGSAVDVTILMGSGGGSNLSIGTVTLTDSHGDPVDTISLGESFNIMASVSGSPTTVYASITRFGGSSTNRILTLNNGVYIGSYTPPSAGEYSISVHAQDSENEVSKYAGDITVTQPVWLYLNVKNGQGSSKFVSLRLYEHGETTAVVTGENKSNFNLQITSGVYDLEIYDSKINLKLNNIDLTQASNSISIRLDDAPEDLTLPDDLKKFVEVVAADPNVDFEDAVLTFLYNDSGVLENNLKVLKCENWNMYYQRCDGSWTDFDNATIDKDLNKVTVYTDSFSAYGLGEENTTAVCGNGIVEGSEECDGNSEPCNTTDNRTGTRTCSSSCTWNACVANPYCGDGSCDNGETCSSCPEDCGMCDTGSGSSNSGGSSSGSSGGSSSGSSSGSSGSSSSSSKASSSNSSTSGSNSSSSSSSAQEQANATEQIENETGGAEEQGQTTGAGQEQTPTVWAVLRPVAKSLGYVAAALVVVLAFFAYQSGLFKTGQKKVYKRRKPIKRRKLKVVLS